MTAHPLAPLLAYPQWIVVRLVPLPNGKTDKLPVDHRTGHVTPAGSGGAHNPAIWQGYVQAMLSAQSCGANHTVGFVITAPDPFWCLDIDNALQADNTWSPLALSLCQALPGTVVEVSQSGRGLHVWGQGVVPPHASKRVDLGIELYTELRFIAIGTGHVGDMSQPCPTIAQFAAHYFPPAASSGVDLPGTGPRADWLGPPDTEAGNADLLRRAMMSRSATVAFGGTGATFADLWHADAAVLARAYRPDSSSSEPYDRSSADAALFQHLAFWTGCDQGRMLRIAQGSALKREKWEREDYIARTIAKAAGQQRDVLQDKPGPASPVDAAPSPPSLKPEDAPTAPLALTATMTPRAGAAFLLAEQQAVLFSGCIYVADHHRVLVPGGRLYKPDQFKTVFGGHTFSMDAGNERTTRDAFEAFTQSQVLAAPWVDGVAFKPALPFGTIIESEGRRRANTYWPAKVRRVKGDPTPFLNHIARLFPNPRDQSIMLYYMAGCVQFVGNKFQWFPLLVGVEGNGKSFLSRCLAHAVGHRYTHWPTADKLGGQFNAWMFGKVLFCIEDLKIGNSTEGWERFKPFVTGDNLEIEAKGVDQRTDEVCGNLVANSNHRDAIIATLGDRRVAHLWCAQQAWGDLARDGITEAYTNWLYDEWAKRQDGYAIVAEFLHSMVIPPEFGLPWLMGRAPRTSSTDAALEVGRGRLEQEVLEQIDQGTIGFREGWVSSTYLDRFLAGTLRQGGTLAPNKRRELMRNLGYEWHAALKDGRVNNEVLPDQAKPRLYLRLDHPARALTLPADVARAYSEAQLRERR